MLHTTVICSLEVIHSPFSPGIEPRNVGPVAGLLVNASKREEDGHRVDILRGAASGEPVAEPILYDLEAFGILRQLVVLPDSVQANTVGPLPVAPAFGIDYSAVFELEEELASLVFDVGEVIDQELDCFVHVRGRNVMLDGRHFFLFNFSQCSQGDDVSGLMVYCKAVYGAN